MADARDVLTLAEGKQAINMAAANPEQDEVLERHITAISELIDEHCGPVVRRTITAEIHEGGGSRVLLRYWPVASITLVREATGTTISTITSTAFGGSGEGYYATPFDGDPTLLAGVLRRRRSGYDSEWACGASTVEVTYVAGRYTSTATVDARFKDAAAAILRRLWKREAGTWAQTATFFEDGDQQFGTGFFRVAQPIINEMLWVDQQMSMIGQA